MATVSQSRPGLRARLARRWVTLTVLGIGYGWILGMAVVREVAGDVDLVPPAVFVAQLALVAVLVLALEISTRRAESAQRVLADRESQLHHLLDLSPDAIVVVQDGRIAYANAAAARLMGVGSPDWFLGRFVLDIVHPDDRELEAERLAGLLDSDRTHQIETRLVRPDGTVLEADLSAGAVRFRGRLAAQLVTRDAGPRRAAERAREESERRLRDLLDSVGVLALTIDPAGRITFANRRLHELTEVPAGTLVGRQVTDLIAFDEPGGVAPRLARAMRDGRVRPKVDIPLDTPHAGRRSIRWHLAIVRGEDGVPNGIAAIGEDMTDAEAAERDRTRLATAIDQSTDAVVITDRDARIQYVNPAFERVSGYTLDEVRGENPRVLQSGEHNEGFYRSMWAQLADGHPWIGELVNRRRDGSLFREMATISPVRDERGEIANFVAVKKDVTRERALEDALERDVRERSAIVAALERIDRSGSREATGRAICEEVLQLPGIDIAAVFDVTSEVATTLAFQGPADIPVAAGRALPAARASYLRDRSALGPWAEIWRTRPEDGTYGERMAQAGVQAIAYVPLRDGERVFGILGLGTLNRNEAQTLLDRLPALAALGAVAGTLLGPSARGAAGSDAARTIDSVITDLRFSIVFQPIVELRTGEAIGFEALSRFAHDDRPDRVFRTAAELGRGSDLEAVTLAAAVAAAAALPPDAFLSLNVSAAMVLDGDRLGTILSRAGRPIALELTEHAAVDDYARLRELARQLPVPVRLAVDDAGAGFASLRHVLELAPDIVKIDLSIVRGIDRDPARQALVAGLRHFASRRGIQLIAEGIETEAELAAVTALAVPLGQGYLLGRPAAARELTPRRGGGRTGARPRVATAPVVPARRASAPARPAAGAGTMRRPRTLPDVPHGRADRASLREGDRA